MQERKVQVPSINCGHCTKTIIDEVEQLDGVEAVEASVADRAVTVRFGPPASWEQIAALMDEIGHPPVS